MREAIEKFIADLSDEEYFCLADDEWQFRNGTACAICTTAARHIAERFNGQVLGYHSVNNPGADIGLPNLDGHDFALIDDRWLVDYWAWHVARLVTTPIFDLKDRLDHADVHWLYGDAGRWSLVHSFVDHGQERQLDPRATHPRIQSVQPDSVRDDTHAQPETDSVGQTHWTSYRRRFLQTCQLR